MSAVIGSKKINFSEEQGMLLDVAREFVKDKSPGSDYLLYTSPSPRDRQKSRMPSSA